MVAVHHNTGTGTGTGSDSDILTPILHVAKLLRLFSLSLSTTSHSASHITSSYILSAIYVACWIMMDRKIRLD